MIQDFATYNSKFNPSHTPHILLDTMIQWTLYKQEQCKKLKTILSKKQWLKEYCTIRFCLPRQSGHSCSAVKLANQYFLKPCFILYNKSMKINAYKLEKDVHSFATFNTDLISRTLQCIVVDLASLMSSTKQEKIYNFNFDINQNNLILFLE